MAGAVRVGDMSAGHCFFPRPCIGGSPNVFINGKAAHRVGDSWPLHRCHKHKSHDSVMAQGSPNVFVNGKALARVGDMMSCTDIAAQGSSNVFIN